MFGFFSIENIHINKFCSEINFLRRALCCRRAAPAPLGQQGQLSRLSGPRLSHLALNGPGLSWSRLIGHWLTLPRLL